MTSDQHLLTDIALRVVHKELRPVYRGKTAQRHVAQREAGSRLLTDLATVSGRDNLAQAVIMRLLTPVGELAPLGHPNYGSRLHELIGRENTPTNHNLIKLYILESLKQEPRIAAVSAVEVAPHPIHRMRVDVTLTLQPAGTTDTVQVGPFTLRLSP